MNCLNRKATFAVLVSVLLVTLTLPAFISETQAQTTPQYYVTVNPTTQSSTMYTAVGQNWTLSFEAKWTYGDKSGQTIQNAVVTIQVTSTTKNQLIDSFSVNVTAGTLTFNYSSSTADILKFNATKLVTQDGTSYEAAVVAGETGVFGLESESVTVWWDTFHVTLVSANTPNLGATTVEVNVTYLLLPEEGLSLPDYATYSHQTFLPKAVHGASVTINGVAAEESTTAGIYTATVPTAFSTAYVHVGVSQDSWVTTHTGFSFAHTANGPLWISGAVIALVAILVIFGLRYVSLRKTKRPNALKQSFPFFGGILLAVVSVISLYWGLVGVEGMMHGFDWGLLVALGLVSFGLGISGAVLSLKRKNQALVLFAVCLPLVANLVPVQTALESYQLAVPWITLMIALGIGIASALLISNADEQFSQNNSNAKLSIEES